MALDDIRATTDIFANTNVTIYINDTTTVKQGAEAAEWQLHTGNVITMLGGLTRYSLGTCTDTGTCVIFILLYQ
jgi:hypothetical protein